MKVRLTQPGFENFTGPMGNTLFEDGLSTTEVSEREFNKLSAVMKVEREDGTTSAPVDVLLDNANTPAPMPEAAREAELESNAAALAAAGQSGDDKPQTAAPSLSTAAFYTREQLAAIADKDGIKGLRAIATPLGVKDNKIVDLIEGILKKNPAPPVEEIPAPAPAPAVAEITEFDDLETLADLENKDA